MLTELKRELTECSSSAREEGVGERKEYFVCEMPPW